MTDKHVTKIEYMNNNQWCMVTNLWPNDLNRYKTCAWGIFLTKPTDRQVRRHRKHALLHKRRG